MTIDFYQRRSCAPCRAVVMTANHIGVKLNSKIVNVREGEHMKPEFLQQLASSIANLSPISYISLRVMMNPQHCVPLINDNGFYLWESRAIMAYLVSKYDPGNPIYPEDPQARAVVDRLLNFDIATLYTAELDFFLPRLMYGQPADPKKEEHLKKGLELLEIFLSKTPYVAGNHITIADFAIVASLAFIAVNDYSLNPYPKVSAYMERLKSEIPNYKEINIDPFNKSEKSSKTGK